MTSLGGAEQLQWTSCRRTLHGNLSNGDEVTGLIEQVGWFGCWHIQAVFEKRLYKGRLYVPWWFRGWMPRWLISSLAELHALIRDIRAATTGKRQHPRHEPGERFTFRDPRDPTSQVIITGVIEVIRWDTLYIRIADGTLIWVDIAPYCAEPLGHAAHP